jgi:hypothetical protein
MGAMPLSSIHDCLLVGAAGELAGAVVVGVAEEDREDEVGAGCVLGAGCAAGAGRVVGAGCVLGAGCAAGAGRVVGTGCVVGGGAAVEAADAVGGWLPGAAAPVEVVAADPLPGNGGFPPAEAVPVDLPGVVGSVDPARGDSGAGWPAVDGRSATSAPSADPVDASPASPPDPVPSSDGSPPGTDDGREGPGPAGPAVVPPTASPEGAAATVDPSSGPAAPVASGLDGAASFDVSSSALGSVGLPMVAVTPIAASATATRRGKPTRAGACRTAPIVSSRTATTAAHRTVRALNPSSAAGIPTMNARRMPRANAAPITRSGLGELYSRHRVGGR